ncbi:MAG: YARHG domain-containing protein [Bacteroidales bacterium]|nr:YARHG domain-containing protein [Bacteroidales bacterium]
MNEDAPYKSEDYLKYYSDFYKDKNAPPQFDFNIDLSEKSFQELRLLRAEILARHGYLFMDYVLRSYFNATKWYQPVFWYPDFKIKLSEEEKKFLEKVLTLEQELYEKNYLETNGQKKPIWKMLLIGNNLKKFQI